MEAPGARATPYESDVSTCPLGAFPIAAHTAAEIHFVSVRRETKSKKNILYEQLFWKLMVNAEAEATSAATMANVFIFEMCSSELSVENDEFSHPRTR